MMDVDCDEQRLRDPSLIAVVGKYSPLMWYHDSVCGSVVKGVVEPRSIAEDVYGVLVPPQQSIRTEIRDLTPRVAGDGIGKGDLQSTPLLAIFLPWCNLFAENPG
jgi:hypothetical protein